MNIAGFSYDQLFIPNPPVHTYSIMHAEWPLKYAIIALRREKKENVFFEQSKKNEKE